MVTTAYAADVLRVSRRRVVALIATGKLVAIRDGRQWLINSDNVSGLERRGAGRPLKVYRDDRPFNLYR